MIHRRSVSIGGIMWVTFIIAFGLAALRNASGTWAGVTFLVTCGVLALAIIGAVCRPASERPWWLGFALFGSGYLWLALWDIPGPKPPLPTEHVLRVVAPLFGVPIRIKGFGGRDTWYFFQQIGHCLFSLLFGTLGGLLSLLLSRLWVRQTETPDISPRPANQPRQSRWQRPAVLAFGGLVALVIVTLVGYPWAPEPLSNTIYLLTWSLIGLAILGTLIGREGRRREWLGVALFGGGYLIFNLIAVPMTLSLRSNYRPTNHLVEVLRPWLISGVKVLHGYSPVRSAENARVLKMLDKPIPMKYPDETPWEDMLKDIKSATKGPNDNGLPIYVDPVGLIEAEKTMTSPIVLDLEGIPLKTSLQLALRQLGLCYYVRDGLLTITSQTSEDVPYEGWEPDDPYDLIGHCLLAWLAAGVGGLLAPLVAEARREGTPAPA
jgi:hypothetical protein